MVVWNSESSGTFWHLVADEWACSYSSAASSYLLKDAIVCQNLCTEQTICDVDSTSHCFLCSLQGLFMTVWCWNISVCVEMLTSTLSMLGESKASGLDCRRRAFWAAARYKLDWNQSLWALCEGLVGLSVFSFMFRGFVGGRRLWMRSSRSIQSFILSYMEPARSIGTNWTTRSFWVNVSFTLFQN